jgi:hypothetical protein
MHTGTPCDYTSQGDISISIYPSICLSIHPSIHPSIYPSIHPSISLSISQFYPSQFYPSQFCQGILHVCSSYV